MAVGHEQDRQQRARVSRLENQERIVRNLHDTVIQRLFAAGLTLQAAHARPEDASPAAPDRREGLGIGNITARARQLGGDCSIELLPAGGTCLSWHDRPSDTPLPLVDRTAPRPDGTGLTPVGADTGRR